MKDASHSDVSTNPWAVAHKPKNLKQIKVIHPPFNTPLLNPHLGRWPEKSCKVILGLLQNLEANAQVKNLEVEKLLISHVQVNKA